MKPLLITYSTREGQARRIAEHIDEYLRAKSARAVISDATGIARLADFHPTDYEGVLFVASVHNRRHDDSAVQFARRHADALNPLPSTLACRRPVRPPRSFSRLFHPYTACSNR
jgi:menaquinone-dependent protoporphyrinogen IX oxidase